MPRARRSPFSVRTFAAIFKRGEFAVLAAVIVSQVRAHAEHVAHSQRQPLRSKPRRLVQIQLLSLARHRIQNRTQFHAQRIARSHFAIEPVHPHLERHVLGLAAPPRHGHEDHPWSTRLAFSDFRERRALLRRSFFIRQHQPRHVTLMQRPRRVPDPRPRQPIQRHVPELPLFDVPHIPALAIPLRGRRIETARTSPIATARTQQRSLHRPLSSHSKPPYYWRTKICTLLYSVPRKFPLVVTVSVLPSGDIFI